MSLAWTDVETRLGTFTVVAHDGHVVRIRLPDSQEDPLAGIQRWIPDEVPREDPSDPVLQVAAHQVQEYAQGRRRSFDLPLKPLGTPFQQDVWEELARIPYGETRSYADLAAAIGRPGAARAVGQANARNPLPIVQPCHRVLNADGALGGWMGGVADEGSLKAKLLAMEAGPSDGLRPVGPPVAAGLEPR